MIEITHLTKRFDDLLAVDDISFTVNHGEVLGFLGPNGAGKSTTMKMIAGFLSPTAGKICVGEFDITSHPIAVKQQIGYLPEGAPLYGEMTPIAFLKFTARARGLSAIRTEERIAYVSQHLHLDKVFYQPIETLSKGYKRRVGLAASLLHDPSILILDEPTDGLDPNQKFEVRSLIQSIAHDKTIIISTHILEEVSAVCSRCIIIDQGKLVSDEAPQALQQQSRHYHAVTIQLANGEVVNEAELRALPGVRAVEKDPNRNGYTLFPNHGAMISPIISQWLQEKSLKISAFSVDAGRLEDVFRKLTNTGAQS